MYRWAIRPISSSSPPSPITDCLSPAGPTEFRPTRNGSAGTVQGRSAGGAGGAAGGPTAGKVGGSVVTLQSTVEVEVSWVTPVFVEFV